MGYIWILQFLPPPQFLWVPFKQNPCEKKTTLFLNRFFTRKTKAPSCQSCMVAGLNPKANIPDLKKQSAKQKKSRKKKLRVFFCQVGFGTPFVVHKTVRVSEDNDSTVPRFSWLKRSSRLFMSCANGGRVCKNDGNTGCSMDICLGI